MLLRCFFASLVSLALCAQERPLILKAARLLDVRTGKMESPAQLWIKGGRIQPGAPPADAEILDLGDRALLPGLIDCHTHLLIPAGLGELGYLKRSQGALVLDGVVNARKVLEAGFTTVRDVGASANFGDVALRDAIARGDAGILEATLAGVRSIEHGSLLSPATAKEMQARGTFLVPTLYALESILLPGNPYKVPEGSLAKARAILPLRRAGFKAALDAGVPIAYGTDIGVFEHGQVAMDFRYLVSYGMTPLQAIQSATVVAARLLRLDAEAGTLEAGRVADIIAVDGDPLKDITTLERVRFVVREGWVVRRLPGQNH